MILRRAVLLRAGRGFGKACQGKQVEEFEFFHQNGMSTVPPGDLKGMLSLPLPPKMEACNKRLQKYPKIF